MKNAIVLLFVAFCYAASAQNVGINTNTPGATLHVVGKPTTTTVADGITIPALTGDQLKAKDANYGATQTGTLIYVTAAVASSSAKTVNVTTAGFYYFDGGVWQRAASAGATDATNDAFVNDAANTMVKLGTQSDGVTARGANSDFVVKDDGKTGIGTPSPAEKLTVSNGNVSAPNGWVRGFATGQLLNSVFVDDPPLSVTTTSSSTYVDLVSYSYTPVYTNSKILVQYFNNNYTIGGNTGGTTDEFKTQLIIVGPGNVTENTQTMEIAGSPNTAFRTGTLFPIAGVQGNTATSAITIKIQIRKSSGDDTIVFNGTNGTLVIQEIAN